MNKPKQSSAAPSSNKYQPSSLASNIPKKNQPNNYVPQEINYNHRNQDYGDSPQQNSDYDNSYDPNQHEHDENNYEEE